MSPKISVILPVYNAPSFVSQAIKSILKQTYRHFELIVVANGSNQLTLDEINKFSDSRIKTLLLEQPDVVAAMNAGIKHAQGKYIARMDADDIARENRLEVQAKFLDENPDFDVVSGHINFKGDKKGSRGYYLHVCWLNTLDDHNAIFNNRFVDSPVANPSIMVRQSLFEKYGVYLNGPFPEDYEMILRWLHHGVKIGKVKETVLSWRDHPDRLTRNHEHYSQDAFYSIKTTYFAKWFRHCHTKENEVMIWGTGKSVRDKSKYLYENGLHIAGCIDVKVPQSRSSVHNTTVYHYTNFPKGRFILSYVSDRKGRLAIIDYLEKLGYTAGRDYYLMS